MRKVIVKKKNVSEKERGEKKTEGKNDAQLARLDTARDSDITQPYETFHSGGHPQWRQDAEDEWHTCYGAKKS